MEYVPGIKISNVQALRKKGFSPEDIARRSGECFMIQLLRHGFFHCDPHPGNIAVDEQPDGSPRLVYYDFGMVDTLSESFRGALVDGVFALYESDPDKSPKKLVQALIDGELLGGKIDRIALDSIVRNFVQTFRQRLALDRSIPMSAQEKDELRMKAMRELGNELAAVASDKPFRYPRSIPYVLRAFNALEGVGKALDPNYDITRIAKKFITTFMDLGRDGSAAVTVWKKVLRRVGWRPKDIASLVQSPRRVTQVYETLNKLESGELQLRVRAVELERAMVRNTVMQRASLYAIAACCAINVGTVMTATSSGLSGIGRFVSRFAWLLTVWFGSRAWLAIRKFKRLSKAEKEGDLTEYLFEATAR
jgi:predicted unusual protein kinase regulating ubiquinone biosynthesis (AarF/ABC1/UbiB family)